MELEKQRRDHFLEPSFWSIFLPGVGPFVNDKLRPKRMGDLRSPGPKLTKPSPKPRTMDANHGSVEGPMVWFQALAPNPQGPAPKPSTNVANHCSPAVKVFNSLEPDPLKAYTPWSLVFEVANA